MTIHKNLIKSAYLPIFAALSFASVQALAGPKNDVPFKASFTTTEGLQWPSSDESTTKCRPTTLFQGSLMGNGTASHVGKMMLVGTDCVSPDEGVPVPGVLTFTQGDLTMTAANGDTLKATYGGMFTLTNSDPVTGQPIYTLLEKSSTFKIVGGTGRFANATGSGSMSGTETINFPGGTAAGKLELSGTISYPK